MDEDKELYNEYLKGNMNAFEKLALKYKNNLIYFIYKYVRNEEIAEDIFQDVLEYILSKKEIYKQEYSFKSYIYMIAKSRALNYIKRNQYTQELSDKDFYTEQNLLEQVIFSKERQEKMRKVISKMKDDYQIVVYLGIIEGLSYKEIGQIMNKTNSQIKNLMHRAKIKLRNLLIEEKIIEIKGNKIVKLLILILTITLISTGIVYAITLYYNNKKNAELTPTYTSELSTVDNNKIWVGTFNLVWNDFMNEVIGKPIEFENKESKLASELNKQTFTTTEISEKDYYKAYGASTLAFKEKIEKYVKEKFNEIPTILDDVKWENPNSFTLYAILKKNFNYLENFEVLASDTFNGSKKNVKYFGAKPNNNSKAKENVEVLFYNSTDDFAVSLKTKENEEVILYKTLGVGKSFEENYIELKDKQKNYYGEKILQDRDSIKIPFIKINETINYDDLCGDYIKGTPVYIRQAMQTVEFELNNTGGSVKSESLVETLTKSNIVQNKDNGRNFDFDTDFILYLKEKNKDQPYLALKVDNIDILISE